MEALWHDSVWQCSKKKGCLVEDQATPFTNDENHWADKAIL
jgi:hypothetical protein